MRGNPKLSARLRWAAVCLLCASAPVAEAQTKADARIWVGTWAASQQIPEPANALPAVDLDDATLREVVHVSCGGKLLRVHLSNAFGTQPLHLTSVHIASPVASGSSAVQLATDQALLFNGSAEVSIPPGAEYLSDPIAFPLAPLADLAISMHVAVEPGQQTGHPGSRQTTFYTHGDLTAAADLPAAHQVAHWYMLSGVDVQTSGPDYSVVVLGDSITDGHAATTNGNDRWPDVFAQRLQVDRRSRKVPGVGVLNQGIGGNHLLSDGLGPNALARFDRDVLAQSGVRYVIVLEGVNDLGGLGRRPAPTQAAWDALVQQITGAYQQMLSRAHAHGLRVYGATIMPYTGSNYYHADAASERSRQLVNAWIRTPGHFDAVIDFDKVMSDPANPQQLLPAYDSGDHLHPGPAGYRAMGQSIALSLFK